MNGIHINLQDLQKGNWSAQDMANAEIVIDFVQHIMNDHDFEYVETQYGTHRYKQHNRTMTDGIQGVIQAMREVTTGFPDFTYDVRHVYVDGEFVTLQSHATFQVADRGNPNKGLNIYDTWKIVDREIVEHWDAVQGIDLAMRQLAVQNADLVNNDNTLF